MSDHRFKLPPFAEFVSSASAPTILAHGSRYDKVDAEKRTTTSTAGTAPSLLPAPSMQHAISSPRLASSPPRTTTTTTTTTTAANPGQQQQHHQNQHAHHHRQHQQPPPHPSHQYQHRTPNTSPAFPFTPLSLEFPSPALSRTSHEQPIAASGQPSAVPEREIATSQRINQSWTASHPLMHATPPDDFMPYDHNDRHHSDYPVRNADAADPPPNHAPYPNPYPYSTKPLSPAPSPEHVSPLSAAPQRRTTSPQPRPRDSTSLRLTHRSRASSDPEPNTVFLHGLPHSHPFSKSNMPPPSSMKPTYSLEPSAEIDDASGNPNQIRCKSCHQVWEYTQPDALAARAEQPDSQHNMVDFTTRILANLQRQIEAKNEKFLEWKNQHIVDPVDGDEPVYCAASMADVAGRGSKRKADVPLEDASVNSKLRKLSVDPPNASQLTPPPETNSSLGQASRPPLHARILDL